MTSLERKQIKLEKAKKRAAIKKAKKVAQRRRWRRRLSKFGGFFAKIFSSMIRLFDYLGIRSKVQSSILAQLLIYFFLSLIIAVIVTVVSLNVSVEVRNEVETSYSQGYEEIFKRSDDLVRNITHDISETEDIDDLFDLIENTHFFSELMSNPEIYITDTIGNVLAKNDQATAEKLDILEVAEKAGVNTIDSHDSPQEIFRVFKIDESLENGQDEGQEEKLLVYIASPRKNFVYSSEIIGNGGIMPYFNGLIAFIFVFVLLARKKMKMMTEISDALLFIADGDLNYIVEEEGSDEIALLAENINYMTRALKREKEEQQRIEETKSELITNVSHDLRTPLTSIMGYLGLIKNDQFKSKEDMLEYAEIAYNKSENLKVLIDDLFEFTKYANSDIELQRSTISMNQLLEQIVEEYSPVLEENQLEMVLNLPQEEFFMNVDAKRIVRVCENLLMNGIKYSIKPSIFAIKLKRLENGSMHLSFENKCDPMTEQEVNNLFERMYKTDKSRTASGSGLGLAITKGIVEAHEGRIFANQIEDSICIGFEIPHK